MTEPMPNVFSFARATNFIEVMAPCFHREALKKCIQSFGEEVSSYGVDDLWFHILGKPKRGLLIFDTLVMEHTVPIHSLSRFPNALVNADKLRGKYDVVSNRKTIGYMVRPGIWLPPALVRVLGQLFRFLFR